MFISFLPFPPPKYLGHVEVEESRGMHVCEDAVKKLKAVSEGLDPGRRREQPEEVILTRPLCSLPSPQMGRKSVKSVLWVSADGLRVVDDKTKVGGLYWGGGRLSTCPGVLLPRGPSRLRHVCLHQPG